MLIFNIIVCCVLTKCKYRRTHTSLVSFMLLEKKPNFLKEIFIFNLPNKLRKKGIQSKSFGKITRAFGISKFVFTDFFQTIKNIILEKNSIYIWNYIFTVTVLSKNKNISKDHYSASRQVLNRKIFSWKSTLQRDFHTQQVN